MSAKSDYLENKFIDLMFRGRSYSPPATLYFALFTAAPSDSGGGTEVSGTGYARVAVATGDAAFLATQGGTSGASSGTGGQTSNANAITFPAPGGAWGVATHWGAFDASSGGNLLVHGTLAAVKTINGGDPAPAFGVGALVYTES